MFSGNPAPEILNSMASSVTTAVAKADAAMTAVDARVIRIKTIANLRVLTPVVDAMVFVNSKNTDGDGQGALYWWDASDTATAEDTLFLNTIISSISTNGRWKRSVQRTAILSGSNVMTNNGGFKSLFGPVSSSIANSITGVSNGQSIFRFYNTTDGTANGPLFIDTLVWTDCKVIQNATDATNAYDTRLLNISADKKTIIFGLVKPTIQILALALYNPTSVAPSGIPGQFKIEGY